MTETAKKRRPKKSPYTPRGYQRRLWITPKKQGDFSETGQLRATLKPRTRPARNVETATKTTPSGRLRASFYIGIAYEEKKKRTVITQSSYNLIKRRPAKSEPKQAHHV